MIAVRKLDAQQEPEEECRIRDVLRVPSSGTRAPPSTGPRLIVVGEDSPSGKVRLLAVRAQSVNRPTR